MSSHFSGTVCFPLQIHSCCHMTYYKLDFCKVSFITESLAS